MGDASRFDCWSTNAQIALLDTLVNVLAGRRPVPALRCFIVHSYFVVCGTKWYDGASHPPHTGVRCNLGAVFWGSPWWMVVLNWGASWTVGRLTRLIADCFLEQDIGLCRWCLKVGTVLSVHLRSLGVSLLLSYTLCTVFCGTPCTVLTYFVMLDLSRQSLLALTCANVAFAIPTCMSGCLESTGFKSGILTRE